MSFDENRTVVPEEWGKGVCVSVGVEVRKQIKKGS